MAMPVVLGKFTDQGAKSARNPRQAVHGNSARGQGLGIEVHGRHLTDGQDDFVVVAGAPDEYTLLARSLGVAGPDNARTETLRAYTLDEVEQTLQQLGTA